MIGYSLIAAVSDSLVIGSNNRMPWHIPEDLKLFKRLTSGNIIIMGRKTFDSIGKALPGRKTIVITRNPEEFKALHKSGNISVCTSLTDALTEAEKLSGEEGSKRQIFVAGGASIYKQAIDNAEKLYLSRIPGEFTGDTFFPEFSKQKWKLESTEAQDGFSLEIYLRR
jgi:dihydrofolate reductase